MNKGTVLYHKKFKFTNGQLGEKLLIILNTPKKKEPYLFCRTTSKQKYNIIQEGCHSNKNIYVLNANTDLFKEKTWIQFHEIYVTDAQAFLQDHFKGSLEIVGNLKEDTIRALINCISRSQDISDYHLKLLK